MKFSSVLSTISLTSAFPGYHILRVAHQNRQQGDRTDMTSGVEMAEAREESQHDPMQREYDEIARRKVPEHFVAVDASTAPPDYRRQRHSSAQCIFTSMRSK
ncbi:hypothetical protein C8R43DRAFT_629667 [Mycena crocata]|nr:hypothetical protein C8R43DRAFT_629667 [Mycena crocata]